MISEENIKLFYKDDYSEYFRLIRERATKIAKEQHVKEKEGQFVPYMNGIKTEWHFVKFTDIANITTDVIKDAKEGNPNLKKYNLRIAWHGKVPKVILKKDGVTPHTIVFYIVSHKDLQNIKDYSND